MSNLQLTFRRPQYGVLAVGKPALLVLDKIQKMPHWSETVKRIWEEDSHAGIELARFLDSPPDAWF